MRKNSTRKNGGGFFSKSVDDKLYANASSGDLEKVKKALENGANINKKHEGVTNPFLIFLNGTTPLMVASIYGYKDVVEYLLEKGADPKIKSKSGKTAEEYAKKSNQDEIVKMLKEASNSKNNNKKNNNNDPKNVNMNGGRRKTRKH